MEKRLNSISISSDFEVKIKFQELLELAAEESDGEDKPLSIDHTIRSSVKPHKDLLDSMKKLRKFALESCEISLGEKDNIGNWNVSKVSIAGDVLTKQSRLVMTVSKFVKRTGKYIEFDTPQITMYPEKDDMQRFEGTDKMTPIVEDVIEEVWMYLSGDKLDDTDFQYSLFPSRIGVEA